jgi:diguanylate cyclase (GGDEF)-like protein
MPYGSPIGRAAATAKGAVILALAGTVLIVAGFLAERAIYQSASETATERLLDAHSAAEAILIADERLTMSASMTAATGERRWMDRYEEIVPLIEAAIAHAIELAPQADADRFDAATRAANDALIELERRSFAAVASGDTEHAMSILEGSDYARHKEVLRSGTAILIDGMVSAERANLQAIRSRAAMMLLALALATFVGIALLWRLLGTSLDRSAAALLEAEDRVRSLAKFDVLTGLANRHYFRTRLEATLKRCRQADLSFAVLAIDLDHFKSVNDKHGHLVGDVVLKEVAQRMVSLLGPGTPCSRYGGDEFVALYEFTGSSDHAERIADQLVKVIMQPFRIESLDVQISASVGVAVYPGDGRAEDALLRRADVALLSAKRSGRGVAHMYEPAMDAELKLHERRIDELKNAIENGYIEPYFQPIVDMQSGRVRSLEILSRWQHPVHGLVPPSEFIPMAEKTGLIDALTLNLLRVACRAARDFPEGVPIAVNIAPQQIQNRWLSEQILGVLVETGFPARRLEIELTENALVSDVAAAKRVIQSLKNLGIRVVLDDFGTGYSSLSYLSELSFDKIKIDQSFVERLGTQSENVKIVSAVISLGKSLGVPIVAEGVETEIQADMLRAMGCTYAQGHLYARALPAADVADFMNGVNGQYNPAAAVSAGAA